ncbi:MAG: class I SAM-dependent RNA methyltransferase [Nitratireductor sp.]|nr:class I SAM-dependent RNA methyltransferase [Nitratireductor sp.]
MSQNDTMQGNMAQGNMAQGDMVRIEALGHRGDGIGRRDGETVHVPFTLPGEKVAVCGKGPRPALERVIEASAARVEPACRHFGACGGCQLQHMEADAYRLWKTGLLRQALEREGLDCVIEPIRHYPVAARRRAVLSARLEHGGWRLGYTERASHHLVDIDACPILVPALQQALAPLRDLLRLLQGHGIGAKSDVRITLLAAKNGIDCALSFRGRVSDRLVRDTARHAGAQAFIRVSYNGEVVFETERPLLPAGLAFVTPPPEGFVQAAADAEADMASLMGDHLSGSKRVADLFSGFGTFALRLAERSIVHAADSEAPALAALDRAWRETGGRLKQLTSEKRDLFRAPMMARELKPCDSAVFDPPRAGAEAQCRQLAISGVRRIAAVSCNPQTLARDLRILLEGGYRIAGITPIDQFAFSPHLEAVALLER